MGNRAIIQPQGKNIGVYLHWNGGRDSVEAFLKYCKLRDFRPFEDGYGMARFIQVVANFFGGSLSIGIGEAATEEDLDWLDNGVYIVKGWDIVDRKVWEGYEESNNYDVDDFVKEIDACQPESDRLGKDYFNSAPVQFNDIKEGKEYLVRSFEGDAFRKIKCTCEDGELGYINKYDFFTPFTVHTEIREVRK